MRERAAASEGGAAGGKRRARLVIGGAVQGVGFRPFIYRLARELGLSGWVSNSSRGVLIEVEGSEAELREFVLRVKPERPPLSFIQSLETTILDPVGCEGFEIRASDEHGEKTALILPDIATCPDCLREVFDPRDRRFGYPFTNCTHCGPRFSIIEALPYDRANTSMRAFTMCAACQAEYTDPTHRRFHAQPNACPACGPRLELWTRSGEVLHAETGALDAASEALLNGDIVAVKGLGGFHLMTLAADDDAVRRLRKLKQREAKPFALMFPALAAVEAACEVSPLEARLLRSSEAPIVLLRRRAEAAGVAESVAPGNPTLGVMLPYTPLHHLLLARLRQAVVATSGNLTDEPICTDEREALRWLGGIADLFLVHNRPIVRHVDDSLVRVVLDREMVLRRARGYAPLPVSVAEPLPPVLAVGAHLKSTVALARGQAVFLSQHLGDLETPAALAAFERAITDLTTLLDVKPEVWAADSHPDYLSTRHARRSAGEVISVQHHYAHVLACQAENQLRGPVLGVSWDGTGYGADATVWGGEFLRADDTGYERLAHLRMFPLPGGEAAVREPRRIALGLLYALFGERAFALGDLPCVKEFSPAELTALGAMLRRRVNCPLTSSAGRLFDAVASLAGLRHETRFEGQTAMELEFALDGCAAETAGAYSLPVVKADEIASPVAVDGATGVLPEGGQPRWVVDWVPLVEQILADVRAGAAVGVISARFHNALADAIVGVAHLAGEPRVVLTGGCFQNRYLIERAVRQLQRAGRSVYWHQRVPPNDGGIALGQAVAAGRKTRTTET